MGWSHNITFHDIAKNPAGNEVGDGAVFLDFSNANFGNEFAVAADEQFSVFEDALVFTDIQDDKIEFGIRNDDCALQ